MQEYFFLLRGMHEYFFDLILPLLNMFLRAMPVAADHV